MSPTQPIPLSSATATHLPHTTRNEIYSSMLASGSIQKIESTLTHELQRTGWLANLKQYITQLLRSGEATTLDEIMTKVKVKMGVLDGSGGDMENVDGLMRMLANGVKANGVNGAATNGVNGVNGQHEADDIDLKVPRQVITTASNVIRKELESFCEVVTD